jgi:hypothetical protein
MHHIPAQVVPEAVRCGALNHDVFAVFVHAYTSISPLISLGSSLSRA